MNHLLVILIATLVIGIVIRYLVKEELLDRQALNKEYAKLTDNTQCHEYLQTANSLPTWRLSLIAATLATIVSTVFYYLLLGSITRTGMAYILILFLIIYSVIYKLLAHYNWHYVCDHGCLKEPVYKNYGSL